VFDGLSKFVTTLNICRQKLFGGNKPPPFDFVDTWSVGIGKQTKGHVNGVASREH